MSRRAILRSGALAAIAAAAPAAAEVGAEVGAEAGDIGDLDHLVVRHRRIEVEGIEIFYREAGRRDAPALLLLHGFPSSSHMFRHLIPALADRYRLVAPDYPGFGHSAFPDRRGFDYGFASYARLMAAFADAVGLETCALYIQDYGAPIGLRLALLRPQRVTALIVQNGNAYAEGLSPLWDPIKAYWRVPSSANRAVLRNWLGADGIKLQYSAGLADGQLDRLAPDSWALDWQQLSRPGNIDLQLDLFGDYETNVDLYPAFQSFLREHCPPTLVLWGRNDPFFTIAGALAFRRDLPDAELHLLDGSHFLLETDFPVALKRIRTFLGRSLGTA
jgi:pimeloyl-ACP methyl ester carboxylesterase